MENRRIEAIRLVTVIVSLCLSLFYYYQGDIFVSGALSGVAGCGLLRFVGEILSMIKGDSQ